MRSWGTFHVRRIVVPLTLTNEAEFIERQSLSRFHPGDSIAQCLCHQADIVEV